MIKRLQQTLPKAIWPGIARNRQLKPSAGGFLASHQVEWLLPFGGLRHIYERECTSDLPASHPRPTHVWSSRSHPKNTHDPRGGNRVVRRGPFLEGRHQIDAGGVCGLTLRHVSGVHLVFDCSFFDRVSCDGCTHRVFHRYGLQHRVVSPVLFTSSLQIPKPLVREDLSMDKPDLFARGELCDSAPDTSRQVG